MITLMWGQIKQELPPNENRGYFASGSILPEQTTENQNLPDIKQGLMPSVWRKANAVKVWGKKGNVSQDNFGSVLASTA